MSKTAEERIAELESRLQGMQSEKSQLQGHYNQAYKAMEEARQNESYLKGQVESMRTSSPQSGTTSPSHEEFTSPEITSIEGIIDAIGRTIRN